MDGRVETGDERFTPPVLSEGYHSHVHCRAQGGIRRPLAIERVFGIGDADSLVAQEGSTSGESLLKCSRTVSDDDLVLTTSEPAALLPPIPQSVGCAWYLVTPNANLPKDPLCPLRPVLSLRRASESWPASGARAPFECIDPPMRGHRQHFLRAIGGDAERFRVAFRSADRGPADSSARTRAITRPCTPRRQRAARGELRRASRRPGCPRGRAASCAPVATSIPADGPLLRTSRSLARSDPVTSTDPYAECRRVRQGGHRAFRESDGVISMSQSALEAVRKTRRKGDSGGGAIAGVWRRSARRAIRLQPSCSGCARCATMMIHSRHRVESAVARRKPVGKWSDIGGECYLVTVYDIVNH